MDPSILPTYVTYNYVLTFGIGAILFALLGLLTAWLIRCADPYPEKLSTYECGERPIGPAWVRFNIRYYYFAILFLIFDVEIIFFFPWAVAFKSMKPEYIQLHPSAAAKVTGSIDAIGMWSSANFGFAIFGEMLFFIFMLIIGWVFAWRKGFMQWD